MVNNYLIFATGRGRSYAYMMSCDEEEVTSRCHNTLQSGFEIYIYQITPSPLGKAGFDPVGSTPLKRVWHLYDAHEEFKQEALDIINKLDGHSIESSREYLKVTIKELYTELQRIGGTEIDNCQPATTTGS